MTLPDETDSGTVLARPDGVIAHRRLFEVDDGESYWIMAPTSEGAMAYWLANCADGHEEDDEVSVEDVTDKADTIAICEDGEVWGPHRSALKWMQCTDADVAMIGASVW